MTLQSSGAISISDLATEFGGTAPHSLSEYYRGGGLVPDTATNAGIPSSGQIQLDDFYGGSVVSGLQAGSLWFSGYNIAGYGKGGSKVLGVAGTNNQTEKYSSPVQTVAGGTNWQSIQLPGVGSFAQAIKTDGRLWLWGSMSYNYATNGATAAWYSSPVQIYGGGTTWSHFGSSLTRAIVDPNDSLTSYHAIKTDGRLWGWGDSNVWGYLGNGNNLNAIASPVEVASGGTNWDSIASSGGAFSRAATKTDGRLWMWGSPLQGITFGTDITGAFGRSDGALFSSPIEYAYGGTTWAFVSRNDATYGQSYCGVKTDGRLWMWGMNGDYSTINTPAYTPKGWLALNNTNMRYSSPVQIYGGGTNWVIAGSGAGVKTDGRMWFWGATSSSGFFPGLNITLFGGAHNPPIYYSSPVQVTGGDTTWTERYQIRTAGAGKSGISAIKTDGRLWSTQGDNAGTYTGGGAGDGTTTARSSPVQTIMGGTTWQVVASAAGQKLFAIKT